LTARDAELARAAGHLLHDGACALVGRPGDGTTAVAEVLATRERSRGGLVAWLQGAALVREGDVLRALGHALGATPSADASALAARLRRAPPALIVVDEANAATVEQLGVLLAALGGTAAGAFPYPILVTARHDTGLPTVDIPPLGAENLTAIAGRPVGDADGSPRLAALAGELGLSVYAALEEVRRRAPFLTLLPMGVRSPTLGVLPRAAMRSVIWGASRAALASSLRTRLAPTEDDARLALTRAALPAVTDLLAWVDGAHLRALPDPEDLLLVRLLAERLHEDQPSVACALRVAEARLTAVMGQSDVARMLLHAVPTQGALDRARVAWADGDVLAAAGSIDDALARWDEAAQTLRRDMPGAEAGVLRRSADRMLARGERWAAERRHRLAFLVANTAGDTQEARHAQRGLADVATAGRDGPGASKALADARSSDAPADADAWWLARAAAAMQAGAFEAAREALDEVRGEDPTTRAAVLRRRADLALRTAHADEADAHATAAAVLYAALGETLALAGCLRVRADADILRGDARRARERLDEAIPLHVRCQDLRGLARTLERFAALEEAIGDAEAAAERRAQARAAHDALAEP
jgi:tetratricopeptide (TPR) repeat protein